MFRGSECWLSQFLQAAMADLRSDVQTNEDGWSEAQSEMMGPIANRITVWRVDGSMGCAGGLLTGMGKAHTVY